MKLSIEVISFMKSHPLWEDFEKEFTQSRPRLPAFNPHEDNTAQWKYESGRRDGFDLALKLLKIGDVNEQ